MSQHAYDVCFPVPKESSATIHRKARGTDPMVTPAETHPVPVVRSYKLLGSQRAEGAELVSHPLTTMATSALASNTRNDGID